MTEALVNPAMLRWARERAGLPPGELARRIGMRAGPGRAEARIREMEDGQRRPTFRQAEKWAHVTHVPFGCLYLKTPPEMALPIPDLRTLGDESAEPLGADFFDLLQDVLYKLAWYREYLVEIGAPSPGFVGKFDRRSSSEDVAADIRRRTGFDKLSKGRDDNRLRAWFQGCEEAGVWIMRSGHVGSNTCRRLRVAEFRGFAVADRKAPLVFINGRDATAAQFFTLAHELAHIWLGESGISNPSLATGRRDEERSIERLCNRIAAELLAPAERFLRLWRRDLPLEENVVAMTRQLPASRVVLARRAADLGLVTWSAYEAFYDEERRRWESVRTSGGDFYRNAVPANGRRFLRAVLREAMTGRLLLREAGHLLGMAPARVIELHRRLEGGGGGDVPA